MASTEEYILGTHSDELRRLGFQHEVWASDALRLWQLAGLEGRILDIGCGPGFTSFDLARQVGRKGDIVGVDVSKKYIDFAQGMVSEYGLSNLRFQLGAADSVELEPESFDAIYSRWVMSWIEDVEAALDHLTSLLNSRGKVLFQEYINWGTFTILPEIPEVRKIVEACRESWRLMPSEMDIGRKLPDMLTTRGFRIVHMKPLNRATRPGEKTWEWPTGFLKIYGEQLIQMGLLNQVDLMDYERVLPQWEAHPAACILTPMMIEIIAVKA